MTAGRPGAGAGTPEVTVGVDLGGTGTRLVALDHAGSVRGTLSTPTSHLPGAGPGTVPGGLDGLIRRCAEGAALTGVGIGASGPVDAGGIIRNKATLPGYSDLPLTSLLAGSLGVPCVIDNDAVAAAVGEHACGSGQGSPALLMVTLGTGIGVAMLVDGSPVRCADGSHPEAGHIAVPGPLASCYCGLASCWEQLASRTALDAATGGMTAECAARAAAGDAESSRIFDRYAAQVGSGLTTLLAIYRPSSVVIGGGAARYLSLLSTGIRAALTRPEPYAWTPVLAAAQLGEYSGAIGAAVLGRPQRPPPQR